VRVAIIAPLVTRIAEPQLGGSQSIVADLAAALTTRGHDVDVFASSGSRIDGANVIDTGVHSDSLRASMFHAGDGASRDTPAAREAFARVYGSIDGYDVVHNHAFDAPAIELAPAHTVHTLHLGPDVEIARALTRALPCTSVCVSESQRRAWEGLVRVDAVVVNGVPTDRIPWSATGGPAALCAGRLSAEKGVALAVEIALEAGVPIAVVGNDYDAAYADALRARFAGDGRVAFRAPLPRGELWGVMSASCALLCPILWDEPFGLAAAEAQAAGTPVIGFRRGALAEVVADGTTGALVSDADEAAGALRDAGGFDRARCREHAVADLDLSRMVDGYERVYERVMV
jgi:glycosyltransferase involved in cell wall biosynthesis